MISAHEYTLSVAGKRLAIKDGTVALDEGWSPYAQASVTLALPGADVLAALDPRKSGRARLTLTARYGTPTPASRVTELFGGRTASEITKGTILRRNVLANSSFETGVTGLSPVRCTIATSTTARPERVGARLLAITVSAPGGTVYVMQHQADPVSPGEAFGFSALVGKSAGVSYARVAVQFMVAGAWTTIVYGAVTLLPGASLTRVSVAAVAPAGTSSARVLLYPCSATGSVPADGVMLTDAWVAVRASTLEEAEAAIADKLDGDTADTIDRGYEWEGAAYASPAVERDLSTAWGGQSSRAITAILSTPYNAAGHRDSSIRDFDLAVIERAINRKSATVTLDLASDETYMQDFRATTPMSPSTWTVRAAVSLALAQIGAVLQPGTADGTVSGESTVWEVGTSAWDYAHSLVDAAGLRLWCDERRRWWLTEPLTPDAAPDVYVVRPETSQELDEVLSREEWASGVIVTYEWETSAGRQTQHDLAGVGPRWMQLSVARPYPGAGAAAAILARVQARGSLVRARAVSGYAVTPGWVMQSLATDTTHLAGLVSSVTWDLSADEVTVSSRDLADAPARAWILQPVGYRWTDVPVGMTWQTYTTPTGV